MTGTLVTHSNFFSRMFWLTKGFLYKDEVEMLFPEQYAETYPPEEPTEPDPEQPEGGE